mgnify:CR=1 FL=1
MYEYHSEIKKLLDKVVDKNNFILDKVIELVSETVINDKIIHAFGTCLLYTSPSPRDS